MTSADTRVVETHISTLFFVGDRVFKLAKRVDLPFLRTVSTDERVELARRELELNRRFSDDVYLGLADVVENGELVDRMIVMRRLPADRRLSTMLRSGDPTAELRAVARRIAAVHASAEAVREPHDRVDRLSRNWSDNFDALRRHVGSIIDGDEFAEVRRLAERSLAQSRHLRSQRLAKGFTRDGHGDLTADDVFCLDDGPRVLDCLAFDDDLRIDDVLNDIAFLAMDVHRVAGRDAARALMEAYHEFSNEQHPASLAHHYVAYRAHVRAKVACLRAEQGDAVSVDQARTLHSLALEHLRRSRIRAILVGGGPGAGKTTLAEHLADRFGYVHLATDEIRHDVAGLPRDQHAADALDEGVYDPAVVDATYDAQLREASALLAAGHGVVLDASWSTTRHRDGARLALRQLGVDTVELHCVVDAAVARERVTQRLADSDDASDATPDLVDLLLSRRDPWPSAREIDTNPPVADVVIAAIASIGDAS